MRRTPPRSPGKIGPTRSYSARHKASSSRSPPTGFRRSAAAVAAWPTGGWSVFNAEPWFKDSGIGEGEDRAGRAEKPGGARSATGPRYARPAETSVTMTDYTFNGEDVTISARIENRHADEPINVVGFSGLTFDFDRLPGRPDAGAAHQLLSGPRAGVVPPELLVADRRQLRDGRHDRRGRFAMEDRLDANADPLGLRQLGSRTSGRSRPGGG